MRLYQSKLASSREAGKTYEEIEYERAVPELTFQPNPHKRCVKQSAASLSQHTKLGTLSSMAKQKQQIAERKKLMAFSESNSPVKKNKVSDPITP